MEEMGAIGSSPLTRGKLDVGRQSVIVSGLIPAHAGKTCRDLSRTSIRRAHPRSRGENVIVSVLADTKRGSSPLTRGKPIPTPPTPPADGLIPAHAGKTRRNCLRRRTIRAHPRSRGENVCVSLSPWPPRGSSPLTRGKPLHGHERQPGQRLIPANAGKTTSGHLGSTRARAHPR